ncbi:unnamed protein product [Paramecium sonneborni]|uniref:Uncharacterized protein n=1 Tax=Paramecium sonneborni TaxID=65129 RepID=A0A8S1R723_9CILI|nr:unnamed protein product [Paramecium sonneborni]
MSNPMNYLIQIRLFKNKKNNGSKYDYPVLTKNCQHLKDCFELNEFIARFQDNQQFNCPICNQIATQFSDLIWDIRSEAYKEFHESIDEITIIKEILVNKYYRNKKYSDLFQKNEIQDQFLISVSNQNNSLLNSLIYQNQNVELKLICLLDYVKINIPTRIKYCTHLEFYELTSLLYYQQNKQQNEKYFICTYQNCYKKIDISILHILKIFYIKCYLVFIIIISNFKFQGCIHTQIKNFQKNNFILLEQFTIHLFFLILNISLKVTQKQFYLIQGYNQLFFS